MIHQFALLTQRRFLPYFNLQFLGALNDNLYKTSLMVLIAITFADQSPDKVNFLNNMGAAAFIFPFFLFSATAGQLADKYNKRTLIRIIKFAEIIIALLIGVGFYINHFPFLLFVLFLLGMQSAFFSPVKYSVLPQYLEKEELMGGNGMVEMGTFIAILLGTILGGLLISLNHQGKIGVFSLCLIIALSGWIFSLAMPVARYESHDRALKINWEPFSQTLRTLKKASQSTLLLATMIAISWFWFFGSMMLTQIPNYTRLSIGGDATVMTLLLIVASLGIGLGSLACEPISRTKYGSYLVIIGAIGMTVFTFDLSWVQPPKESSLISATTFLHTPTHYRILIDLFLIGFCGGLYSVPLYVALQIISEAQSRSQTIAANSILNALFMTFASVFAIVILKWLSIPDLYMILSLLNIGMIFFYWRVVKRQTISSTL